VLHEYLHGARREGRPYVEADELEVRQEGLSFRMSMEEPGCDTKLDDLVHNFSRYNDSLRANLAKPQPTMGRMAHLGDRCEGRQPWRRE